MNIPPMMCENRKANGEACKRAGVNVVLEWFPESGLSDLWTALFYCPYCTAAAKRRKHTAVRILPLDAITYTYDPKDMDDG